MFHWFEQRPFFFAVLVFIFVAFAGIIEAIPDFAKQSRPTVGTKPYSVLELAGRHVYIKDSCNACHSQLIRPFKSETDRYGMYSLSGEYAYDRLLLTVQGISSEMTKKHVGETMEVLVEEINGQDPELVTGRLSNSSVVHFKGTKDLIGKIVNVRLDEAKGFYYLGTMV